MTEENENTSPKSDSVEELQGRIQRLKDEEPKAQAPIASIHLAFSLGATVIGSLLMGDFFGRKLAEYAGNPQYRLVGWALGLGLAGLAGYKLLKPYIV